MADPSNDPAIQQLIQKCDKSRAACKKLRRLRNILTLVFVATILSFVFAIYREIAGMYTAGQFEPYFKFETQRLTPIVQRTIANTGQQIIPVYKEAVVKKFEQIQPELQKRVEFEASKLAYAFSTKARDSIEASLNKVFKKQEKIWRENFPVLMTDDGTKLYHDRVQAMLDGNMREIILRLYQDYGVSLESLQGTIDSFRGSRFDGLSQEDLSRYYAHLWLMLLDYQLMDGVKNVGAKVAGGDNNHAK